GLHELAAFAHEPERVTEVERAARDKRRELTERMSREDHVVGRESFGLRCSERRDRRREDRRLCVRGELKLRCRPLPAERTQIEAERVVRFLESTRRIHEGASERLAHSSGLRSLPGK